MSRVFPWTTLNKHGRDTLPKKHPLGSQCLPSYWPHPPRTNRDIHTGWQVPQLRAQFLP